MRARRPAFAEVRRGAWAAAVLALIQAGPVAAHELESSRATLILRDGNHVSMTLYLNLPEVLRKAIAPERGFGEFVLVYSAMEPDRFAAAVKAAEARLETGTRLTDGAGVAPARSAWSWPEAQSTQAELRMLAAELLTAPKEPPHDDPVAVRAEFQTVRPTSSLRVAFPTEMDGVLTVFYRPGQVWLEPGKPSPPLDFDRPGGP